MFFIRKIQILRFYFKELFIINQYTRILLLFIILLRKMIDIQINLFKILI